MTELKKVLQERGSRYGDFKGNSNITQRIKEAMKDGDGWDSLTRDKKEALEMTAHKIGRIINGDPEYKDSWVDIAGYITLVSETLTD